MNIFESSSYVTAKISILLYLFLNESTLAYEKKQALRMKMKCSHIRRNN